MKTERTQIHFLSDVLVVFASLDLKVRNDADDDGRVFTSFMNVP